MGILQQSDICLTYVSLYIYKKKIIKWEVVAQWATDQEDFMILKPCTAKLPLVDPGARPLT